VWTERNRISHLHLQLCLLSVFLWPHPLSTHELLSSAPLSLSSSSYHNRNNHLLNFPIQLSSPSPPKPIIHGIQSSMRFLCFSQSWLLHLPCQVLKPSSPILSFFFLLLIVACALIFNVMFNHNLILFYK